MIDAARQEIAAIADIVVVKVGTRVLTDPTGALDTEQIAAIAGQISRMVDTGRRVVLVSSGAVGAGIGRLKLDHRPTDLSQLQAAAAIGQSRLIEVYNQEFEKHDRHAAQVLLTADDLNDRQRCLNVRNTLMALFDYGAIPVVNENDTVRVDELQRTVGDNDQLAAIVANLIRAPLLVLLSDIEGLYDRPPHEEGAQVLPIVEEINDEVLAMVSPGHPLPTDAESGAPKPRLSTGGMASKLNAAAITVAAGESVIIANGRRPYVLDDLLAGKPIGTLFPAQGSNIGIRKRWIGWTAKPQGKLLLDAGARRAIEDEGGSLLAVGLRAVKGRFDKGDVVAICDENGEEFARGLTNYTSEEVDQIKRHTSDEIEDILGHCPYNEVVHRDNLTLVR